MRKNLKTDMIRAKDVIFMDYSNCELCPRVCGVNRTAGERGFCGCPDTALVAKAMLHKWEEPALAGNGGRCAVDFTGRSQHSVNQSPACARMV